MVRATRDAILAKIIAATATPTQGRAECRCWRGPAIASQRALTPARAPRPHITTTAPTGNQST